MSTRENAVSVVCPDCESESFDVVSTRKRIADRDGQVFAVQDYELTRCRTCGFEFVTPKQTRANDLRLADTRRRHAGYLMSSEIRAIRDKLRLTQEDASKLFGGGPNAFSKYECGYVQQSASMDKLLRLVDRFPFTVLFLFELAGVPATTRKRPGKVVPLCEGGTREFEPDLNEIAPLLSETRRLRDRVRPVFPRRRERSARSSAKQAEWTDAIHG